MVTQVLQRVRWREEFRPLALPSSEAIRLLLLLDIAAAQGFPSRNVAVRWQLNWDPGLWTVATDGHIRSPIAGQLHVGACSPAHQLAEGLQLFSALDARTFLSQFKAFSSAGSGPDSTIGAQHHV